MSAEMAIRFVFVAQSSEMGGDLSTSTYVAWLEKGIAIMKIESRYSKDEELPIATINVIGMDGETRRIRTVRFEEDESLRRDEDALVVSTDDLYDANEHGDRYEALKAIAIRLVREDAAQK